ncbi:MAG: M15 family metallopeptidase [Methylobacter sp.]|nr:M15 family metallopeptidase [Methylobacter sp.]
MSGNQIQGDIFQKYTTNPIPPARSMNGWQAVPISKNGEPLADVTSFDPNKIIAIPKYYEWQIPGSLPICYVRESVGLRLALAANHLPDGWKLVIFDAWRPIEVQAFLYHKFVEDLRRKHPDWTAQELLNHAQTYVSLPSTELSHPSPHLTGGAVDLSISDDKGALLDMGTEFDEFIDEACTCYFEKITNAPVSKARIKQRDNRRFLYNLLTNQGFTNYTDEWWHFDYGNQFWALQMNEHAKYSVVKPE